MTARQNETRRDYIVAALREAGCMYAEDAESYLGEHEAAVEAAARAAGHAAGLRDALALVEDPEERRRHTTVGIGLGWEAARDVLAAAGQAPALDFFQPGHTYTDDQYGWKFRADIITTHPKDGERTALGWRFWNDSWEPCAYGEDDWDVQRADLAGQAPAPDICELPHATIDEEEACEAARLAASTSQPETAPDTPVVAYRNPDRPGVLLCREHGDDWAGLIPLTSDDLPDGGLCTWGMPVEDEVCGRDVLAPQPAPQPETTRPRRPCGIKGPHPHHLGCPGISTAEHVAQHPPQGTVRLPNTSTPEADRD